MKAAVWQLALLPNLFATMTTAVEEDWKQEVRRLQDVGQFMQVCNQSFMSDMNRKSYLMSDFANDVSHFCAQFATTKSNCPQGGFQSLETDFQDAFFRSASQHMGIPMNKFPVGALTSLGDTGYIFSKKTQPELDSMRNDLCVQMQTTFGGTVQLPKQIEVTASPSASTTDFSTSASTTDFSTEATTESPTALPRTPRPSNPSPKHTGTGTDLGGDQDSFSRQQNDLDAPKLVVQEDTSLSVGAIIGIAMAVAVVLASFFYFEARRRNLARQVGILAAAANRKNGSGKGKSLEVDTAKPPPTSSRLQKSTSRSATTDSRSNTTSAALHEIREAVNNANWDNIYRLASQLAEEDEAQSLPGPRIPKDNRLRSHLNAEDQERTKTLDDLMARGDWTGVAVTAALYAGESGSSHEPTRDPPSSSKAKKTRKSLHHDEDDWKQVHVVSVDDKSISSHPSSLSDGSAHARDLEQGQTSVESLVRSLNEALNAGDWAQVNFLATKIKEEKGANGGSMVSDDISNPQALMLASGSSRVASNVSQATTDTDASRRQTIEKLIRAEKWKGVSIMANLYGMESNQPSKSSLVKASRGSKRPPRSIKEPSRTKELRHSDRVDENIVGFRQDEEALVPSYGNR